MAMTTPQPPAQIPRTSATMTAVLPAACPEAPGVRLHVAPTVADLVRFVLPSALGLLRCRCHGGAIAATTASSVSDATRRRLSHVSVHLPAPGARLHLTWRRRGRRFGRPVPRRRPGSAHRQLAA